MSEFSESYHLKSSNPEEAVNILRTASLKGYVFPPQNGWVSFVAEEGSFEPDERIIKANHGFLLHYVSAEDHGWSFAFFAKDEKKIGYRCDWDDDVRFDDTLCSEQAFRTFISDFGIGSPENIWARLHPADIDEAIEEEVSKLLAQALGLGHYEWFSYDYVDRDFHSPDGLQDAIEVK